MYSGTVTEQDVEAAEIPWPDPKDERIRELEEWLGHAIESLRHSHRFGQESLANSLARVLKEPGGKEARDCPPLCDKAPKMTIAEHKRRGWGI